MRQVIQDGKFDTILNTHYSQAVRIKNTVYVAGQLPVDDQFKIVAKGDVVGQARKVFDNMEQVLVEAGASLKDVVQVEIYVMDINVVSLIGPVRREYFGSNKPAATLVQVAALVHPEALIEVSAIAVIDRD
jgi:2-iminobutanoate/2-iminopropanoate deaminase